MADDNQEEQWLYVSKELAGLFKGEPSLANAEWAEIPFRWKSERNFRESWSGGRERKGKHSLSRNKKLVENEDKLNSLKSHSKCLINSLKY